MTVASGKRLGKILVQAGVIDDAQLEQALLASDGTSLAQALVDAGLTT